MDNITLIAVKNLLPFGAMISGGPDYESIIVEDGIEKPSLEKVEFEIENIKNIQSKLKSEYPTPEQWIIAFIQKELDNDPSEWNTLKEVRNELKNKYKKYKHLGIEEI
jgi:hypothetical protein